MRACAAAGVREEIVDCLLRQQDESETSTRTISRVGGGRGTSRGPWRWAGAAGERRVAEIPSEEPAAPEPVAEPDPHPDRCRPPPTRPRAGARPEALVRLGARCSSRASAIVSPSCRAAGVSGGDDDKQASPRPSTTGTSTRPPPAREPRSICMPPQGYKAPGSAQRTARTARAPWRSSARTSAPRPTPPSTRSGCNWLSDAGAAGSAASGSGSYGRLRPSSRRCGDRDKVEGVPDHRDDNDPKKPGTFVLRGTWH